MTTNSNQLIAGGLAATFTLAAADYASAGMISEVAAAYAAYTAGGLVGAIVGLGIGAMFGKEVNKFIYAGIGAVICGFIGSIAAPIAVDQIFFSEKAKPAAIERTQVPAP